MQLVADARHFQPADHLAVGGALRIRVDGRQVVGLLDAGAHIERYRVEELPARNVRLDELAELIGRHRHGLDRFGRKALAQRWRGERLVDLGVESLGDLRRQPRRPHDPVPLHAVEALEPRLFERRDLWQGWMTLEARDCDRAHLLGADVRQRRGEPGHHHHRWPTEEIGERRTNAAVMHGHRVELSRAPELLHREVSERADAARGVADLLGIFLHIVHEALKVGHWYRRTHQQYVWGTADHRDRGEVLDRIVPDLAHRGIGAV